MFVSSDTVQTLGKCFFTETNLLGSVFDLCSKSDLAYVLIFWTMIHSKLLCIKHGIVPGFEGWDWIKTVFPGKFDFFRVEMVEVDESKATLMMHKK